VKCYRNIKKDKTVWLEFQNKSTPNFLRFSNLFLISSIAFNFIDSYSKKKKKTKKNKKKLPQKFKPIPIDPCRMYTIAAAT